MLKKIALSFITLFLLVTFGCSSDIEPENTIIEQPAITDVTVSAFSAEYAYVNDQVSILGENFNSDASQVSITLDDVNVDIISITESNITIKIPEGINVLPNLSISMPNSSISYNSSLTIAILDNTKNKWIEIDHFFPSIDAIRTFNGVAKERVYFSLQENTDASNTTDFFRVKKSFNGGATATIIDNAYGFSEDKGTFLLGKLGGEYMFGNSLNYKSAEGESSIISDFSENTSSSWGLGLYVDDTETNIIVATAEGRVFRSTNSGATIEKVHENDPPRYEFLAFYAHSPTQIWLAGYTFPSEVGAYGPAKMLYLKEDGNWYNKTINIEIKEGNYERIQKIYFIDGITGFAIAKINNTVTNEEKYVMIKSETTGDTWNVVHESNQEIEGFTFKDVDTGWYVAGKEIFKTTDGGISWTLEYTNDTNCKGILYNEDILWVIADGKFLKYYF